MPLIVLGAEHKEHLQFLTSVEADVLQDFLQLAIDFIRNGTNPKAFTGAGKKLGVAPETVQSAVEGLMYLFTECSKLLLSDMDFHDSIMTLGFSEQLNQTVLKTYLEHKDEIRKILNEMAMALPTYQDLQWRLDVQLASRSLRNQTEPSVVLKLDLKDDAAVSKLLQTDPTSLLHLTQELDNALKEIKAAHFRKIARSMK